MLVLSRKIGEQFVIGGNITVHVVSIHGNRVKLGITAPKDIKVVRDELAAFRPHSPIPPESEDESGIVRPIDEAVRINDHC